MKELRKINPVEFLATFNADMEAAISSSVNDISDVTFINGSYSLNVISLSYGEDLICEFVKMHLVSLNEYCSTKSMDDTMMNELARQIVAQYGYINQFELCLFFARLKSGRYCEFYGSVDPLKIMSSLNKFLEERKDDLSKMEARKNMEQVRMQRDNPRAISYNDWIKLHPEDEKLLKSCGFG